MMVTDARTAQGNVPKANPGTNVNDAIHRFNFAMEFLGAALVALNDFLDAKADEEHQHSIDDISELSGQLQSLIDGLNGHTHAFSDLVDVNAAGATEGQILQYLAGKIQAVAAKAQYFAHDPISGLTSNNVQTALAQLASQLEQLRGGNAPELLDTIQELANALGDDPNFATTVMEHQSKRAIETRISPDTQAAEFWDPALGDWVRMFSASIFYGLKRQAAHLVLETGEGNFVSQNYLWWDLKAPGVNFSIDANGHLIAEIM